MLLPTVENLKTIRVLFLTPFSLTLCGIPYEMCKDVGQEPRHLWESSQRSYEVDYRKTPPRIGQDWTNVWIYLGEPGWFGEMSKEQVELTKAFREKHKDILPGYPYEWVALP